MIQRISHSVVPFFSLLLCGCVTNTLTIGRAETMSEAGRSLTEASLVLIDDAKLANRTALIELAANDPNCSLPSPRISMRADATGLCDPSSTASSISYARIGEADLLPTLGVIKGLTAYLDAVDKIVTRETPDLAAVLTSAHDEVQSIADDFAILAGASSPALTLSPEQKGAIEQTAELIANLITEAKQVSDLRELERGRDVREFENVLSKFETMNEAWADNAARQYQAAESTLSEFYRQRPPAGLSERRASAMLIMDLIERREQALQLKVAIGKLSVGFKEAHADYLDILNNPASAKLTEKEKKLKAEIIRSRVRASFASLAALLRTF